jgi:hypothetical protein
MIKHAWLTLLKLGTEGMSIDKRSFNDKFSGQEGTLRQTGIDWLLAYNYPKL